jgi:hypothetical protein
MAIRQDFSGSTEEDVPVQESNKSVEEVDLVIIGGKYLDDVE